MCAFKSRLPHKLINMIEIKDGKLFIDGVLANAVILVDNRVVKDPFYLKGSNKPEAPKAEMYFQKNVVIPGSIVSAGGNVTLGDGH